MGDPISSISNLVLTVGNLLYEESIYLNTVAEKLERLRTELVWMKCFLKDAAARRSKQEVVKAWVSEVRKHAYDAEDIIDMEIKYRSKSRISCSFLKHAPQLHKMGKLIDELVGKISDLNRRAQTYGINPHSGSKTSPTKFLDDQEIERDHLVGLDTYIQLLVSVLLGKQENRRYNIVTVSGMGGLGKTTLARKLYHNNEIRTYFNRFAWTSISKQFQVKETWQNILLQLESRKDEERKKEIRALTAMELGTQLRQLVQENKCLVVVDDLWDNQDWDSLKEAIFPEINSTTKILITSRNQGVAELEPNRFLLTPTCLDEDQSLELLQKIVFPPPIQNHSESKIAPDIPEKMELARNMIKHCGGLPLAIRVLGGLLKPKVTLDEWRTVNEQITTQIARGGGSEGHVNKGVRNILASSYDDLRPHLKSCFLYMAQFPEDYEIDVNKLVEMWIAEGMVEMAAVHWEEEQEDIEYVGEGYLQELMRRSVVLPGKRNFIDNKPKTCRLHDLMRDLCLSKAREENMLEIMNGKVSLIATNVWRLAIHDEVKLKDLHPNPNLRSLWLFCDLQPNFWRFVSKEYKLVRVVNLEGVKLQRSPYEIGELSYLKMLVFGNVNHSAIKLPSSLGKLRRLQTLYLPELWRTTSGIMTGKWMNLRKLINIRLKDVNDIERLGEMTQLKVVKVLQYEQHFSKEMIDALNRALIDLRLLRSLNIFYRGDTRCPPIPLRLGRSNICKLVLSMRLSSLLGADRQMIFPVTLTHLEIEASQLDQDPMPILEKLPNLQCLKLGRNYFLGEEMVCSKGGFPNLDSVQLGLESLERMIVGEGAMSRLRRMSIKKCFKWETFPDALSSIKSLQELHLHGMPRNLTQRLVMGGAEHDKVKHMPRN